MSRSGAYQDWVAMFVKDSLRDEAIDIFAETVDAEIIQTLPELGSDPVLVGDLRNSTRHQWIAFLNGLRSPEHGLDLPVEALDLARSLARRSKDFKVLLRVYLSAHRGVFSYLTDAIDRLGGGDLGSEFVLREVWKRADLWMDESVESLIETFFEERQRELDGNAARRAELIGGLLAEDDDLDLDEVSAELGYRVQAWHISFLAWTSRADARTGGSLRAAAEAVAKCFPSAQMLTELTGSRDLRGWVATRAMPPTDAIERVRAIDLPGVSIAIGVAAEGPSGFRSSHTDARAAQDLSMASRLQPRFLDYRSVEVLSLALADRGALERMVRREVGPLCGADKNLEPVRETVLMFLSHRMNVEAAAERLYVHGNTVRYRLAKAEELLGCSLAERPRQIELALQYVAHFGAPS